MLIIWVGAFATSSLVVLLASRGLVKAGDAIGERTGISRAFIGVLLLATATSLPEVFTGASAVAIVGSVDIAAGDIFGSNLFNLMIIALLDLSYRNQPILTSINPNLVRPAVLSILIIGMAALFGALHHVGPSFPEWLFWLFTPALILSYVVAIFWLRKKDSLEAFEGTIEVESAPETGLRGPILLYLLSATAIALAGLGLSYAGEQIAELTGWGSSFVGSFFVALSTSLPEVGTSFAALRIGARDMAITNMLGSNMFNTGVVLFSDDLFYRTGHFLGSFSSAHLTTALITLCMTLVIIVGMRIRPRRKTVGTVTPEVIALLLLFVLAHYLVFVTG